MLTSYLGLHRWGFLVAAAVAVGCGGGNQVSCPAVLESCPATPPTFGAPCAPRGSAAICEYGDDPWYDCNTIAFCDPTLVWHVFQTSLTGLGCPTTLPSECPASFAEALAGGQSGCPSASATVTCRYAEGTCSCAPSNRICTAPAAAGCPATRPRAGTACAAPCTTWGTGVCDGQSMKCVCGTWQPIQCAE